MRTILGHALALVLLSNVHVLAADANRLTYLDEPCDPYYAGLDFPKLVTPQWVGEPGVEAVVTLAVDDMRASAPYEKYLRPLLERLKKIDGRAPVSIMTCKADPADPQLQTWLKEGLSIETHTADHPCPCLQGGDFAKAKSTYDVCVDEMAAIPGNRPVAFRFPCMDSLNTPSPRAFVEIFGRTTGHGNFLQASSSVCVLLTPDDPAQPRALVQDASGGSRFARYAPFRSFVNRVDNYPYPFVISRLCWEFPCAVPDDWQGQKLQKPANPATVADWKAAIDATVVKQGMANLVFHPYDWVRNDQLIDIIDHIVAEHGTKAKVLNFRECVERLTKNLLAGQPLRAVNGQDNGVRILDVNADGFLDVLIGNEHFRRTRIWSSAERKWLDGDFPVALVEVAPDGTRRDGGVRFGVLREDGTASVLVRNDRVAGLWHWQDGRWVQDQDGLAGLQLGNQPVFTAHGGRDQGVRLRDLDNDGRCETLVSSPAGSAVFQWNAEKKQWLRLPFDWPAGLNIVDDQGRDGGLRLVDVDEDGYVDLVFADETQWAVHLFDSLKTGWSRRVGAGAQNAPGAIPPIVRGSTNNGAWIADRHVWWQNEDTNRLPDGVDRRSFAQLLGETPSTPRSPAAALKSFKLRTGLAIDLVAAEPLVMDPVGFDWGPDGKLWVVEMADYPLGIDGKGKPGGRVRYLEDTNGDGRYDRSTLFLDGLNFPNGVKAWRDGVLVTAAPDVIFAADTDGDGKADRREVLYTGFNPGNQQHRMNGLRWGVDNWLYLANGDSGGNVRSAKTGETVNISGRDLRIRPNTGAIETQTGHAQFGRNSDDWGNWFGCNNANPMYHYVLDDHYLRRNPHFAAGDPRRHVSTTPGASPVFPISRTLARFNDPGGANRFTSANSAMLYRDELFGPAFAGSVFIAEPVHNLVHREVMTPQGVTFTSRRADDEERSEFLASSDNWFRPTMLRTGPDGALWIADMYRAVIEHPEWIPNDWEARLDLRAGHDRGRIYRVHPVGVAPRALPRLDRLSTAGLVAALDSPNDWQRDTVQQMLLWRGDKSALPLLESLAARSARPQARLHALGTLEGLGALAPAIVVRALSDEHPGVRRHAVRLSEPFINTSPEVAAAVLKRLDDEDLFVQLQLAYSLGQWNDARAGAALATIALAHRGDSYITSAVMSSIHKQNLPELLTRVLADDKAGDTQLVNQLLGVATAMGEPNVMQQAVAAVASPRDGKLAAWQLAALGAMLDSAEARQKKLADLAVGEQREHLAALFAHARQIIADQGATLPDRLAAVRLLGRGFDHQAEDLATLAELLAPQTAFELQTATVAALARLPLDAVPAAMRKKWESHSPALRGQILDALLGRPAWTGELLAALERGTVTAGHVDAARRQRLLSLEDPSLRARAEKLLAGPNGASRQKVLADHADVLKLTGDPERGKPAFVKRCAVCHVLAGTGHAVGPDLGALANRSPEALIVAILDPNRAIEDRFLNYVAVTDDGQQFTGILATETSTSITLRGQDGKEHVILRNQLDALKNTGKSLMPEGFERDVARQELADIMAYVGVSGPPPKQFPGNAPDLVKADEGGTVRLTAASAQIYGTTLVFEQKYANLGYWSSADDRAVWTFELPKAGAYRVVIDYACPDANQGNAFLAETGGKQIRGNVETTGSWDTYRQKDVGVLQLTAGPHQLTFRSAGSIVGGALIDLRSIRLRGE